MILKDRYGPIGHCIYCGRSDVSLSREHILAYGLGGRHVLLKASCDSCADITKAFEQIVLRRMFGIYRIRHNAPSRRTKDRPESVEIDTMTFPERREGKLSIATAECPAFIAVPDLKPPRLLTGKPEPGWEVVAQLTVNEGIARWLKPDLAVQAGTFELGPFLRMVAKIAHAMTFAVPPEDGFIRILPDVIIRNADPLWYVGGGHFDFDKPPLTGPWVHQFGFGHKEANGCVYATLYVKLFSNFSELPTLEVLVAEQASPLSGLRST